MQDLPDNASAAAPAPAEPQGNPARGSRRDMAAALRPILQALARLIATDRRAVVLASQKGEILLANPPAQRLNVVQEALIAQLDWPALCQRARRAGSVAAEWQAGGQSFVGEVVHVPLGKAEGYMLRLSETDQEATWLRNRARAAMLTRVAHDLRTPIQALLASAEALTRPQDGPPPEEVAAGLRRAAELALDRISHVLAVVRGEQSQKGGQPDEDFRILDEVENLIAMVEPIAGARATDVRLLADVPAGLTLRGPLRFVRALCQNLLDNSVNHGGGRVELRLACTPLAGALPGGDPAEDTGGELWRVQLELLDEGGGLPPAQRARLAEALGLPGEELAAVAGGGRPSAGLNVLAHALRQLGGQISIADRGSDGGVLEPGSGGRVIGTVFTVTFSLPRAPQMPKPVAPGRGQAGAPLDGRRILLVEDSPSSRDWLIHVLQGAGAVVHPAGSGAEALALLSRQDGAAEAELVLTDVTLPRMTGIELTRRLLEGDPAAANPWRGKVVGLTAHADDRIRKACLAAGMVAVLEKPISPDVLCRTLAEILHGGPLKPAAAAQDAAGAEIVDRQATDELIRQLGAVNVRMFMQRAIAEARSVLDELQTDGLAPDTGRRLHAATGACGLTGLKLVEKRLRALELGVKDGLTDLVPLTMVVEQALEATSQEIDALL